MVECGESPQIKVFHHVAREETSEALDALETLLKMTETLRHEPILITCLVMVACDSLAISALEELITHESLSENDLKRFGGLMSKQRYDEILERAIAGERCLLTEAIGQPHSSIFSQDTHRILLVLLRSSGYLDVEQMVYLDLMSEYMEAFEQPPIQRRITFAGGDNKVADLPFYHAVIRSVFPGLGKAVDIDLRARARLDLARMALHVEQYRIKEGRLPDHLADLTEDYMETVPVDPFDDTPIKYRKLEKGYVIYSVGSDGKDDEGMELDSEGKPLADGTDIPFAVRR